MLENNFRLYSPQRRKKQHFQLTGTGAFGVSLSGRPGIRTEWLLGLVCRLLLLLLSVRLVSSCILGLTVKSSDGLKGAET